jgi:hypothetical protein
MDADDPARATGASEIIMKMTKDTYVLSRYSPWARFLASMKPAEPSLSNIPTVC